MPMPGMPFGNGLIKSMRNFACRQNVKSCSRHFFGSSPSMKQRIASSPENSEMNGFAAAAAGSGRAGPPPPTALARSRDGNGGTERAGGGAAAVGGGPLPSASAARGARLAFAAAAASCARHCAIMRPVADGRGASSIAA